MIAETAVMHIVGAITLTHAYKHAEASRIAPLEHSYLTIVPMLTDHHDRNRNGPDRAGRRFSRGARERPSGRDRRRMGKGNYHELRSSVEECHDTLLKHDQCPEQCQKGCDDTEDTELGRHMLRTLVNLCDVARKPSI